ncbi:xanthine dehydrogenase family protein molybdopterin-binding subunit [Aquimarina sp. AD10]|uniref:xanthine dehydrogenase family protein molybdopterin-binding subunit n=1 Tax=Aquimarina sp. AD10 TaxID=1714849 RepID=UPI000E4A09CD|nr:molybdopterin cofactor-binding domain-containing protein [Aquimarina sp. AD10]AXT59999.1 xanthine dehydrogenase family protein molybdopterin-binding subunit [Aquimarina sp. AD10]RKM93801.1 twin-arginine translocation signal domain-containing protein [Aquimarina sp. AD10]
MKKSVSPSFSRRSFIKTSTLAGGGMLIGFNLFQACKPEVAPPVDIAKLNFNDFNAFIKIADNGMVTIFSPNPEIGQGVKTSMPMLIAEELDVSWDKVHVVQGALDTKNFTRQVAGGSQSIRHGWEPLRQTGATARQMLVNAAAARWGIAPSECKTENGVITNTNGDTLGYGDVVKEAAALEVPEKVALKEPKDFKIIGKDASNVDVEKITTGQPLYGLDYKEEGMSYAVVLRPPAFGNKLVDFDDTGARAINGVKDVIKFGDKVAVLATNTWAAMKGKKALKANWTSDDKLENTEDHDKILTDLLGGSEFNTMRADGDVKKAFAAADQIVERTYESPFLPHNCMEPMNFFADVTTDKVRLVGPIQTPAGTARRVAELLDRKPEEVSVDMTRMGGGFGRRLYGDFALEAAEISNLAKKPVKVVYSREDDMSAGIYRPAIKYRITASIKDGEITGYHLKEASVNSNMYGLIPNFFPAGAVENYQVDVANYNSKITTGAWRAPYTNFLSFAEQSFFDEVAEILEKDRIQLRLDLLQKVKGTTDERIQYSPERLEKVIKVAVDKSGWGNAKEGVYQGFSAYYCHNTHVAEVADVVLENDIPVVKKVTCVVDCGIVVNPLGAKNQIEGGVIDGVGHAMYGDFSFKNGEPQDVNFNTYRLIRINETPVVETHFIESDIAPTGLGEPTLPPAGAAVANAIKAAKGIRLYKQPFIKHMKTKAPLG